MAFSFSNSKIFYFRGERFASLAAFCTKFGLDASTVRSRIKRGIVDERLIERTPPRVRNDVQH